MLSFIMRQPYVLYIVLLSIVEMSDTISFYDLNILIFLRTGCKLTCFYIL